MVREDTTHSWTLGHQSDSDRLHLAVVGRELGAGQLRGAVIPYSSDTLIQPQQSGESFLVSEKAGPRPQ